VKKVAKKREETKARKKAKSSEAVKRNKEVYAEQANCCWGRSEEKKRNTETENKRYRVMLSADIKPSEYRLKLSSSQRKPITALTKIPEAVILC
jgi:hypothetical protein